MHGAAAACVSAATPMFETHQQLQDEAKPHQTMSGHRLSSRCRAQGVKLSSFLGSRLSLATAHAHAARTTIPSNTSCMQHAFFSWLSYLRPGCLN